MTLTAYQEELCTQSRWDFSDLRALYVNCTLKPSPELSHTEGLMRISMAIMDRNGVEVDYLRAVDHDLAPGVWPDMREHGASSDAWPELYERVQAADVLGPSYLDDGSGGPKNDFTDRNMTYMTWNLLHLARMVKDAGGVPGHGNQRSLWDAGCRFDFANPDYR